MMKKTKQHFKTTKSLYWIGCLILFWTVAPVHAQAQCEQPWDPFIGQGILMEVEQADVAIMTETLTSVYDADIEMSQNLVTDKLNTMSETVLKKMDWFWEQWYQAWKDMAKQLASGYNDETRQMGSAQDGSDVTNFARATQQAEADAKKLYQTTNEACKFDSTAPFLSSSKGISDGLVTGYSLDFNKIGNNIKGFPAEAGPPSLQKARWESYAGKFCDADANNGYAGCTAAGTSTKNLHILPSKTIFGKETIDLTNADTQNAVTELIFNITGYTAPDIIQLGSLKTSAVSLQQRQTDREYIAQMDAVGALAYSVIADRAPGKEAPGIQAMRQKNGVQDASDRPSAREIRQAVMEQLWNPNFFTDLNDSPATIGQKDVYLKAYSLVMLYDMISRQEKISNVYAIETANLLDKTDHSRGAVSTSAPLK